MEINRYNYEEYFLLYADNELSDAGKIEVLKFIRDNKDLEAEFKIIQDTICKPDDNVVLDYKAHLFKETENTFITQKNYEEIFVLYHDGELSHGEKIKTELFMSTHPQLKQEFEIISHANFAPDNTIIFPKKKNLYRREKSGRVVRIFWRSLAAAIFIGFGLWLFTVYFQQQNNLPVAVENSRPVRKTLPEVVKNVDVPGIEPATSEVAKNSDQKNNLSESEKNIVKKQEPQHQVSKEKDIAPTTVATVIENNKTDNNIITVPVEKINIDAAISVNKNIVNNIPKIPADLTRDASLQQVTERHSQERNTDNDGNVMQVHAASYVDVNDKSENYVFYNITTEEFRKSKVGGFFKKLKRVVERNNPISRIFSSDDNQVVSN